MHGISCMGSDGRQQLKVGMAPEVRKRHGTSKAVASFVLFPQTRQPWSGRATDASVVWKMIEQTKSEYCIDSSRIYLTGIADGCNGLFKMSQAFPDTWAALVPVSCDCGPWTPAQFAPTPILWYQNSDDHSHAVRAAVQSLQATEVSAELVELNDGGHSASTHAYSDPYFYRWLYSKVRRDHESE